jgi:hypothetical protein
MVLLVTGCTYIGPMARRGVPADEPAVLVSRRASPAGEITFVNRLGVVLHYIGHVLEVVHVLAPR